VEAKKALAQSGAKGVIVLVDNYIAVQNLEKMADKSGYDFSCEQKGETEYAVMLLAGDGKPAKDPSPLPNPTAADGGTTFLFTGDQIGISGEEAGKKLMKTFVYSLSQIAAPPETVLLMNAGVKLACGGSEVLGDLKALAERGTDIRSCGQCLTYYNLTEKLAVGKITNMLDIVETLTASARAITL
jgi:selenium metabolism protein YedF